MSQVVSAADVRGYMGTTATTGTFSDGALGSNVRAAESFLERKTGRQFYAQTATTKKFTTDGRTFLGIPDLRSATSVTLNSVALIADSTYYLMPDRHDQNIYTGIQFRPHGQVPGSLGRTPGAWARSPEWFDRGLDLPFRQVSSLYENSLPNDLAITGDWGWLVLPEDWYMPVKVLAAFFSKRPDSVLADSVVTPEGNKLEYTRYPVEVREFLAEWTLGDRAVSVG